MPKLTNEERAEILRVYCEVSPEAASRLAIRSGLAPNYAWKLARAMGIVPRTSKRWSHHLREDHEEHREAT